MQTPPKIINILALGDSYTIGEAVIPEQRWVNLLAEKMERELHWKTEVTVVARTGWTTTDLLNALESTSLKKEYDLVFLLIGVNNQYRNWPFEVYEREFATLLHFAENKSSASPDRLFVLSIPDYGYTPFGHVKRQKISEEIDTYNRFIRFMAEKNNATYIEITSLTREGIRSPELIADDGLHPSSKMHQLWSEKIFAIVSEKK